MHVYLGRVLLFFFFLLFPPHLRRFARDYALGIYGIFTKKAVNIYGLVEMSVLIDLSSGRPSPAASCCNDYLEGVAFVSMAEQPYFREMPAICVFFCYTRFVSCTPCVDQLVVGDSNADWPKS